VELLNWWWDAEWLIWWNGSIAEGVVPQKHGSHKQKPISRKNVEWRFCPYFWYKIYTNGGGLYNLDQNRMAPIFTKTG
jgi:hypothetical protein